MVDSSGGVTITVRSSDSFELTAHAARRAAQRGISIDQIEDAVGGNGFSHYNKEAGVYQTGGYDSGAKVFVRTSRGRVTTVIKNVKQNYVNNLRNAGP
ncbi:MAG: DUF4258 domain-containing protein [Actinomycetota bacterium]|nr:DUF4258 domain-containing protein [Actinomycetota bacterium]